MVHTLLIAAAAFGLALGTQKRPTLSEIRSARKAIYCESCPAGRLKVFADFHLEVEQANPALGSDYFPISDLAGKTITMSRWREETFRSGPRFKERVISYLPKNFKGSTPGTYDLTVCYNGVHSWKYRPIDRVSERFQGVTRVTQIVQDYFGDMIGSRIPVPSATMSRTVPTPSDAVYDIDQVVASDLYEVVGEEQIAGDPCTIIERQGADRIWLANAKNYIVVKREWRWTVGGPLKRRVLNSQFRIIGGGGWLPFSSRMEIFSHPSTPPERRVGILTAVVETADVEFPDSDFEPGFLKGTVVFDAETGTKSVTGSSEEELAVDEAKGMLKKVKVKMSVNNLAFQDEPWWRRHWLAALGAVLVISGAAYLLFRSRGVK